VNAQAIKASRSSVSTGETVRVLINRCAHRGARVCEASTSSADTGRASVYCSNHVVTYCVLCDRKYRFTELAADVFGSCRTNVCPRCRTDLTEQVSDHLFRCAMLPSEVRLRAKTAREAAQQLMKEAQQRLTERMS
jgi:hypothetical protein